MRTLTMDKELLIRMPAFLYKKAKKLCEAEYKSISALVRELLSDRLDDALTRGEIKILESGSKAFMKGAGTDWRKVRRG